VDCKNEIDKRGNTNPLLRDRQRPMPPPKPNKPIKTIGHPKGPPPFLNHDGVVSLGNILQTIDSVQVGQLDEPKRPTGADPAASEAGACEFIKGNQEPCLDVLDGHDAHVVFSGLESIEHLLGFAVEVVLVGFELGG